MFDADIAPYPYPVTNTELIRTHSLEKHFEGGYFAQTVGLTSGLPLQLSTSSHSSLPSSAALEGRVQQASGSGAELLSEGEAKEGEANKQQSEIKTDATLIYYLVTPDSYRGKMHMNLHSTFHLHHSGRALYTLIQQPTLPSSGPPTIHRVVMGCDPSRGEVKQLFVPGGWWKASEIPEEDLLLLQTETAEIANLKEDIGCLISEVVVPGWNPDQHQFISEDKLKAMWNGQPGWEQYIKYTKAPDGLEYVAK